MINKSGDWGLPHLTADYNQNNMTLVQFLDCFSYFLTTPPPHAIHIASQLPLYLGVVDLLVPSWHFPSVLV